MAVGVGMGLGWDVNVFFCHETHWTLSCLLSERPGSLSQVNYIKCNYRVRSWATQVQKLLIIYK